MTSTCNYYVGSYSCFLPKHWRTKAAVLPSYTSCFAMQQDIKEELLTVACVTRPFYGDHQFSRCCQAYFMNLITAHEGAVRGLMRPCEYSCNPSNGFYSFRRVYISVSLACIC